MEDVLYLLETYGIGTATQFFRELIFNSSLEKGAFHISESLFYISNHYISPDAVETFLKEIIRFFEQFANRSDLIDIRNFDFTYSGLRSILDTRFLAIFDAKEATLWILSVSLILVDPCKNGQGLLRAILKHQTPNDRPHSPRCDPQIVQLGFLSLLESIAKNLSVLPGYDQWTEALTNQITSFDWERLDAVKVLKVLSEWRSTLELPKSVAGYLSRSLTSICFNKHFNLHLCLLQLLEAAAKALVINPQQEGGWLDLMKAVFQSHQFLELYTTTEFLRGLCLIKKNILAKSSGAQNTFVQQMINSSRTLGAAKDSFEENFVLFMVFCSPGNLPKSIRGVMLKSRSYYLFLQLKHFYSVDPEGNDQFMETCMEWITIENEEAFFDQKLAGHVILSVLVHWPKSRTSLLPKLFSVLPQKQTQIVGSILIKFVQNLLRNPVESELKEMLELIEQFFGYTKASKRAYVLCLFAPLSIASPHFGFSLLSRCLTHVEEDTEILSRLLLWNLWQLDFKKVLSLNQNQREFVNQIIISLTKLILKTESRAVVHFLRNLGQFLVTRCYHTNDCSLPGTIELEFRRSPFIVLLKPLMESFGALFKNLEAIGTRLEAQLVPHLLRCLLALDLKHQHFFLTCLIWTLRKTKEDDEHLRTKISCLEAFLEHSGFNHEFLETVRTKLDLKPDNEQYRETQNSNRSVLTILLSHHRILRAKLHQLVNQKDPVCFVSFQSLLQIYRMLNFGLRIDPMVLDFTMEISWMTQMVFEQRSVSYWNILKAFDLLMKLHKVIQRSQCSKRVIFGSRRALLEAMGASLRNISSEKHTEFFQRVLEIFSQSEKDCLWAGLPSEVNLEKAMEQFPLTGFLILSIRRIEKVLEDAEDSDIWLCQYITKSLQFLKIIDLFCTKQFQQELENTGNPFSVLLSNFLQQLLLSENPVLKKKLMDLSCTIMNQYLTQMLDLWLAVSHGQLLFRNLFLVSLQQSSALKRIHLPHFLLNLIHSAGIENNSSCVVQLIDGCWMCSNAKQLYRVLDFLIKDVCDEQDVAAKCKIMVAAILVAILTLDQALQYWDWSTEAVTSALKYCTALVAFCERVLDFELSGFQEDWMNGIQFWRSLLRLLAEKMETLLGKLESKTERDLYQIRCTTDVIFKATIHGEDELKWITGFKESLSSSYKVQMEAANDMELLKTTSKSCLYRIRGRSRTRTASDFREWFNEEAEDDGNQPRRKKQKKKSSENYNAFLAACLRESGLANSGVNEEDLILLEDFIVPSQGRNYDEAFQQRFRQNADQRTIDFPSTPLCFTTSSTEVFFGCAGGQVLILDVNLNAKLAFSAHGHGTLQMHYLPVQKTLVTLGVEEPGVSSATVKLWLMERVYSGIDGAAPQPFRVQKLFGARLPESEITCLAAKQRYDGHAIIAVGLASGMVYWMQGDLLKDRLNVTKLNAQPIGSSDRFCVKGMGLHVDDETASLYVVTESQTLVFNLQTSHKLVLEETGADDNCVLMGDDGQLVVSRPQAIYFYNIEGRGACFAFNEAHHHLASTGRNLIVVHNTELETGVVLDNLKIFDLSNKLIVGERGVSNVRHVICAWGRILLVQGDGMIVVLDELPLNSKLQALFRRNCHGIALRVAEAEGADQSIMSSIHQQFGDHLYNNKRDHEGAMKQYIKTIGYLEPSYVIRKYLDCQRIQQLTLYLEELHEKQLAIADHTTLLLNCYTKLKDVEKLNSFIGVGVSHEEGSQQLDRPKIKFDVETAVKVLRMAGYYSHALAIAKSANEPHWYVDILLEDLGDYDEGIKFVFSLPRKQAADVFKKYGKVLITHKPRDSTGCLMKLCVPEEDEIKQTNDPENKFEASVADFTHLYADRHKDLESLCEFVINIYQGLPLSPPGESHLYHTLIELYLSETARFLKLETDQETQMERNRRTGEFGQDWSPEDKRSTALALLKQGWSPGENSKYDAEHMLVLCRMHQFIDGLVFLYERKGLLREVLQVYIHSKDYNGIISACEKYGDSLSGGDPLLWSEALQYFAKNDEDCTDQIKEVLKHIEQEDVLPPLVVLQTLSKNPRLKLKIVKEYIAKQINRDSRSIQQDRAEIVKLKEDSDLLKSAIHKLKTEPQVFNRSMDERSKQMLELPAVHFLCKHSYNLKTIEDNPNECPLCAPRYRETLRIRRDMKAGALQQDQFFMELKGKKNGFAVVAEWFGRGMLNVKTTTQSCGPSSSV
eukprot:g1510.t1